MKIHKWIFITAIAIAATAIVTALAAMGVHANPHGTANPGGLVPGKIVPMSSTYAEGQANYAGDGLNYAVNPGEPMIPATNGNYTDSNGTIITVTGRGSVSLQPDGITISIIISDQQPQPTPSQAYELVATDVDSFISALDSLGVNYSTTGVSLNPVYNYYDGQQQFEGYSASYELNIVIYNPINQTLVSALLSDASSYGATSISMSTYISPASYEVGESAAIKAATQSGIDKAMAVASTLGYSSIRIISIQENPQFTYSTPFLYTVATTASPSIPINPSAVTVTATVNIVAMAK